MPLGRPRRRRRSGRPILTLFLTAAALGVVAAGLWYGYHLLSRDLHVRVATLDDTVSRLRGDLERAEDARAGLEVDLEDVQARLRFTEARYARDVPTGEAKRLLDLVQDGLARGADPDRLAYLIQAGARPMHCDATPTTRLLDVAHPGKRQPAGSLDVADGRVILTAEGQTATDERNRPEDWFDPQSPVRVRFEQRGADPSVIEGTLPLSHKIVVGEAEFNFALAAARRGYMEVEVIRCAFP